MLKKKTTPEYPLAAKQNGITGTVALAVTIGTDGHVKELHVLAGPMELRNAALDAVKEWEFRTFFLNNQPVEVRTQINVVFQLER